MEGVPSEYRRYFDQVLNTPNAVMFAESATRIQQEEVRRLTKLGVSGREACASVWGATTRMLTDYFISFSRRMKELVGCGNRHQHAR
jgi:hypothetical protein